MDESLKHLYCIVKGEVQGVGFRAFAERHASRLGITGWVRNQFDGSVEIEAEGSVSFMEEFKELLRKGPRMSQVDEVEIREERSVLERKFPDFSVRF